MIDRPQFAPRDQNNRVAQGADQIEHEFVLIERDQQSAGAFNDERSADLLNVGENLLKADLNSVDAGGKVWGAGGCG